MSRAGGGGEEGHDRPGAAELYGRRFNGERRTESPSAGAADAAGGAEEEAVGFVEALWGRVRECVYVECATGLSVSTQSTE